MKIMLDEQEICQILNAWAKHKYKTHNVSITLYGDKNAQIEVILGEDIAEIPNFNSPMALDEVTRNALHKRMSTAMANAEQQSLDVNLANQTSSI